MTSAAGSNPGDSRLVTARFRLAAVASLTAFSAAAVGAGLGRALVTTYLPVLLAEIREAPGLIGMVMLVNTVAGFAVPLWIGLWSDRLHARGRSRTGPFIVGGSVLAAGGLAAIGFGHASSYLVLAFSAAVAYVGLNAIVTAHRALIPETFGESGRAAATGAEEFAMLGGTLVGVVAGGFLLELDAWAPFAFGAAILPLLALPTFARMRGRERPQATESPARMPLRYYARAATAPGARLILGAQLLWVLGYIGLPPFFVLYAEHELELRPALAGSLLAIFGVVTGAAILGAGSVRPANQSRMVLAGVVLLGGGLLAASSGTALRYVAPALVAAAVGFGLVTTLGFSLFARFIPEGEEGAYTALYLAVRAVAAGFAVPAAGWTIAVADSYRAVLVTGGAVALLALVPLARLSEDVVPLRRPPLRRALALLGGLAGLCASLLAIAMLADRTRLAHVEETVFDALYGLGGTPELLDRLLVDPHIHNYVALTLLAAAAAIVWRPEELARVLVVVPLAGLASFLLVRAMWAAWERPRPEEVLGIDPANGHVWGAFPSFPSGHVVVTVALVTAIATRIPWLGPPLAVYAAVITVTRISYGAHFPFDVAAGVVIGFAAARVVAALLTETQLLPLPRNGLRSYAMSRSTARRLRRLGIAAGASAAGGFLALALTVGAPRSPDGGIIPGPTEATAQQALLAVVVMALAAAIRFPALGGALLLIGATGIGMLAALEYNPLFAAGSFTAFFVPAVLLLLGSRRARGSRWPVFVAALALSVAVAAALGAFRIHAAAFGPTHPESQTPQLPVTLVRWSWAGGVTKTGFRVVAKLARDGDARLLVSSHSNLAFARTTASRRSSHDDNDRIVTFEATGLGPGRRYFYAVEMGGVVDRARTGQVRTWPRRQSSFTFAFAGCARAGSNGAVFDAIRGRNPLFYLILGDLFYGNIDTNDPEEFRNQYDRSVSTPAQAALYRATPVDYVWDDHDFGANDSDSRSPSKPAALATYKTLAPHYRLPDPDAIYHSFTVSRVRFVVTDTRSARTRTTLLGARQTAWLKHQLLAAKRRGQLAVWVTSVPWIAAAGADSWGGYASERRELANFVARHRIRNLVMLAGDAHMVAIDDGTNNNYATAGDSSFPVMHAAALDRRGELKGGPYSEGAFPGSGQFGTVTVRDTGAATIKVTLTGWNYRGEQLVSHTFARTLSEPNLP
jgi:MFS family permease